MLDTTLTFDDDDSRDRSLVSPSSVSGLDKAGPRAIAAKLTLSATSWCAAVGWVNLESGTDLDAALSFGLGALVLLLTLVLAVASALVVGPTALDG